MSSAKLLWFVFLWDQVFDPDTPTPIVRWKSGDGKKNYDNVSNKILKNKICHQNQTLIVHIIINYLFVTYWNRLHTLNEWMKLFTEFVYLIFLYRFSIFCRILLNLSINISWNNKQPGAAAKMGIIIFIY